jgi:hypothetical protein
MFAPFSFDPQEYIKMMRAAVSTAFLIMYDDYDELEDILYFCNIELSQEE